MNNCLPLFKRGVVLAVICLLSACAAHDQKKGPAQAPGQNHGFTNVQASVDEWWNIPYPKAFDSSKLTQKQSMIKVKGNGFVTEAGKPFLFRGVNIADPDKLMHQGHWNKALFEEVNRWGANTVRLPIHPYGWNKKGKDWYFARIDEAVEWANSLNMYLIIDWHCIGNLEAELFQHPMYATTQLETAQFWRDIALRYKNVPTVAVYEIFNEPTHNYIGTGNESLGKASWLTWRDQLEKYIDLIATYDKRVIPLVAGYNWAYDLAPVAENPIRREGVAYAIHPYPQKARPKEHTKEAMFSAWDSWGYAAAKYPVIATEIGWAKEGEFGAHVPVIHNEGTYGPNLIEYMANKGVSYTVWAFDPEWAPAMIKDWTFAPTEQGTFFKQEMLKARASEQ